MFIVGDWSSSDGFGDTAEASAASAMNCAVEFMYSHGVWLRSGDAQRLSKLIFLFLAQFAILAQACLAEGARRFPVLPKTHMLCHTALKLARDAERVLWVFNPMATACQQQEDFVGKPSRVSRKTNICQVHRTVLWRSMIKVQFSLEAAAEDQRGMDGYPDLP